MRGSGARWVGDGLIGLTLVVLVALMLTGSDRIAETWSIWMLYALYAVVGGLLLRHSARNPIGVFLSVMGLVPLLGNLAEVAIERGTLDGVLEILASWLYAWYFYAFFVAFVPLFHVFPTGAPLVGWWRTWYRVALVGAGSMLIAGMFSSVDEGVSNPFEVGLVSALAPVLGIAAGVGLVVGLVLGVASLGVRFRRAQLLERLQLKWFFFGVLAAVVLFGGSVVLGDGLGAVSPAVAEVLGLVAFSLPALGIFFAVTRHGLFDIDRIVSRTVTYVLVGSVLVVLYAVPVLVLPGALGLSSDLTVAGATLAAAAAFAPLRRRVRRGVDRRFGRGRYDAEAVLADFAGGMQSMVDSASVRSRVGSAVSGALHPAAISVWVAGEFS